MWLRFLQLRTLRRLNSNRLLRLRPIQQFTGVREGNIDHDLISASVCCDGQLTTFDFAQRMVFGRQVENLDRLELKGVHGGWVRMCLSAGADAWPGYRNLDRLQEVKSIDLVGAWLGSPIMRVCKKGVGEWCPRLLFLWDGFFRFSLWFLGYWDWPLLLLIYIYIYMGLCWRWTDLYPFFFRSS